MRSSLSTRRHPAQPLVSVLLATSECPYRNSSILERYKLGVVTKPRHIKKIDTAAITHRYRYTLLLLLCGKQGRETIYHAVPVFRGGIAVVLTAVVSYYELLRGTT